MLVVLAVALSYHVLIALISAYALIRQRRAAPRLFWYSVGTSAYVLAELVNDIDPASSHGRGWLAIGAAGVVASHGGIWLVARAIGKPELGARLAVVGWVLLFALITGAARAFGLPDVPFGLIVNSLALLSAIASVAVIARSSIAAELQPRVLTIGFALFGLIAVHDLALVLRFVSGHSWMPVAFIIVLFSVMLFRTIEYETYSQSAARHAEALAGRARELEEANRELSLAKAELFKQQELAVVGELAAVIAHEVRNPLAIIANAVAGLRKPLPKSDHETLLTIVDEETQRLNTLVRDLLRYARPIELQRQDVDVSDMLSRIAGAGRTPARVDAPEGIMISGDPTLLRQAIENLRDNAAQAVGEGGEVVLVASETDEDVAIEVRDDGEGMDTQILRRAKDAFFTTRPSGTGLGLAIVDRIAIAHGGSFTIASRAGIGTTASIRLPRAIVPRKVTLSGKMSHL